MLFVGQGTYFRSVWHDAVRDGWGIALPLPPSETARAGLPEAVARTGARTCVLFQPQLTPPRVARELRARGVRLVAYSSEPIPHDGVAAPHWDQVRRLDELRPARRIDWDLFLHYDPVSLGVLAEEGFHAPRAQPLPVSEELFFPEPVEPDLDVIFLGWSTPHRESFLARLEASFRVAHVARGLFDEDARRLMSRARVVVNLHVHAYPSFENRCVQALFCGRPLASEPLSNRFLEPGVDFLVGSTPEELVDAVAEILRNRAPAPRFDRARFRAAALRDLLAP